MLSNDTHTCSNVIVFPVERRKDVCFSEEVVCGNKTFLENFSCSEITLEDATPLFLKLFLIKEFDIEFTDFNTVFRNPLSHTWISDDFGKGALNVKGHAFEWEIIYINKSGVITNPVTTDDFDFKGCKRELKLSLVLEQLFEDGDQTESC